MKWLFRLLFLSLLIACENKAKNKNNGDTATESSKQTGDTTSVAQTEEQVADKSQYYIWNVDSDRKTITQNPHLRPAYYNVDTLVTGLNEKYPQIRLEKKNIGHDTLYTQIKDAQYLIEQMGSAGAEQYIAQVVLNLTAVGGIRYVRIDFPVGSHAEPDVWSRESFSDYKEVK